MSDRKTKAYVYIMGKIQDNNSLVRAIEVDISSDNTVLDIIEFLFDSSKIKSKDVWLSLKQNGTKLNEFVTLADVQSMVEDANQLDIHLYVYNSIPSFNQSSTVIKSSGPCPSVFEKIQLNDPNPQQLELIKLQHSLRETNQRKGTFTSFNQQHLSTNENLVQQRPRKLSKKQSIKQRRKDQCCLLM